VGRDRRRRLQLLLGALRRQRLCRDPWHDGRQVHAGRGRCRQDDHRRQHRRQRRRHLAARSVETDIVAIAGPRWKTLPLLSNSNGRVGDVLAITPGVWTGPTLTSDTVEAGTLHPGESTTIFLTDSGTVELQDRTELSHTARIEVSEAPSS